MISAISELKRQKNHSQALSIALEQNRQRYLYFVEHNLLFSWWTLTNRKPTNSLMALLFPKLKALYRLMLDSKIQLLKPVALLSGLGIAFQPRLDLNQQQQLKMAPSAGTAPA